MNITKVYTLNDIRDLDPVSIESAGFEVVTFDLDKTITGQEDVKLTEDRIELFEKFGKTALHVAIASNAFGQRVDRVRDMARQIGEVMGRECLSMVPDDVGGSRKPHADMLVGVLNTLNIYTPYCAMHIGDQIRSDIAAAEGAGFRASVLVKPMGEGDDMAVKYIGRPIIEPWLRYTRGIPSPSKFPNCLPDLTR